MTVLEDLYYGNITPFNEYYQNPETEIAINKNNKITDIGNGSARRYMLSAKVYSITNNKAGYTRQRGWDTLQERELILAHMEKYREIDRQGVVELCRCSPNHASWLLDNSPMKKHFNWSEWVEVQNIY